MKLSELITASSLPNFGHKLEATHVGSDNFVHATKLAKKSMATLGLAVWDRYTQRNPEVNLQEIALHGDLQSPELYKVVEGLIGEKAILDLHYSRFNVADPELDYNKLAELFVAILYPNVLHIGDVEFSDPYQPIEVSNRKYQYQHYKGLGLFPELMSNCIGYATEHDIAEICLVAASADLIPLFQKHGFTVDDSLVAQAGIQSGMSIPMTRKTDA